MSDKQLIYLWTSGEYSDYRVNGVYTKLEKALSASGLAENPRLRSEYIEVYEVDGRVVGYIGEDLKIYKY